VITTNGLTRRFGDLTAVDGLDLHIERGEVFGFLGPNGAGKTTTVRMLAALIAPTSGSASIGGRALGEANQDIRQCVGVLTETPGLYKRLSAWDNLMFFAKLYRIKDAEKRAERYLKMLELWDRRNGMAGSFSKGMRQKLALARALLHEPEILFLDEPTAGLDPEAAKTVRDLIESLGSEERTIFLCTHNLEEADRLCDRVALFKTKLLTVGDPQSLKEKMYGRRTVVHLADPKPGIEDTLNLPFITKTEWIDGRLLVSLSDPDTENPILVRKLVELGADVQFVSELKVSLEDLYLDLMEGNHGSS
jgi:ABC-2 type transport system ATP-binding protein